MSEESLIFPVFLEYFLHSVVLFLGTSVLHEQDILPQGTWLACPCSGITQTLSGSSVLTMH